MVDFPLGLLFRYVVEFCSFVCVCIIVDSTKSNPFEKHIIGNLTDYFFNIENISTSVNVTNSTKSNNSILIPNKKINNIFQEEFEDIKKKKFIGKLRKLVSDSFCLEIQENFEKFKGKRLSSIFDLKYNTVHKFAIGEMVISCVIIFLNIFQIIKILDKMSILLMMPKFAFSFILFYYMDKSDLQNYDDFLECKNVRVRYFKKIVKITKLRNCFYSFVVFNVIILGFEKLETLFEYRKEEKKEKEEKEQYSIKIRIEQLEKELKNLKTMRENTKSDSTTQINNSEIINPK